MGMIITLFFLVTVFFIDLKYKIIPNLLTYSMILFGLGVPLILGEDMTTRLLGAAVGFTVLFFPYLWGWIGGGDVKLLTAIGSITNVTFTLTALYYGLILGGVISLIYLVRTKRLKYLLSLFKVSTHQNQQQYQKSNIYIPLGSCISVAGIGQLFLELLG